MYFVIITAFESDIIPNSRTRGGMSGALTDDFSVLLHLLHCSLCS